MNVFDHKHIKNIVFVGAHNSGKTTLTETMLFEAGLINRRGTVENKTTVSDYQEIEQERGSSVFATPYAYRMEELQNQYHRYPRPG